MSAQKNFRITFDDAVKYIQAYVDKFKLDTEDPSIMNSIGGTMKVDLIKKQLEQMQSERDQALTNRYVASNNQVTYQGLMCWMALVPQQGMIVEHIIAAIEVNDNVNLTVTDQDIDHQILARPFDVIMYDKDKHGNIKAWLEQQRPIVSQFRDRIDRGQPDSGLRKLVAEYKSRIASIEPSNATKPYGLFEDQLSQDVTDFFTQEVKYIRYYFGYDEDLNENKIRIILFGVDNHGNNLKPNVIDLEDYLTNSGSTLDGPSILQTSWPPPTTS
ncbi:hypothetical protein [Roseivirga sp. E12]|uniref:hypothetical protein n=1 Tax=Roseivirga sp. E12 TaxID=2819237 RepID=UPI001ABC5B51|nr:hypothetical protein [Roseivirga sp. E12]MBO3697358.1 hypothetical protein [Roseivirga sp. E12]